MTIRTLVRGLGQTLITAGLVILLFCVYELWFTGFHTARAQDDLRDEITEAWQHQTGEIPPVRIGHGIAVLRVPRLGDGYAKVIVEGVGTEALKDGPGHYPGTALPGEVGNFVVSGHRTTYGAPFNRLDRMRPGDPIVVETRSTWFTYRTVKQQVVAPTTISVIEPVPEQVATEPGRYLTFTTCHPKYSARERLVVFAELESRQPKSAGTPPALSGSG